MTTEAEPYTLQIDIPPALGDVEIVASFMAYSKGAIIDSTSSEPKLALGIPRESKYEALKMTDTPGEMYFMVALRTVRPTFDEMPGLEFDDE